MIGQGWTQVGELALAFVLSATIGLERQLRQKSADRRLDDVDGVVEVGSEEIDDY